MVDKWTQLNSAMWIAVQLFDLGNSLRCYACMGTQPGCSTEGLDWRLVKNMECPDPHDICVKITEKMLGSYLTTRGCLSTFTSLRRDIPSDHYEGCREGSEDVRLTKDVIATHPHQTAIQTSEVTFCFCAWDNYCNIGSKWKMSPFPFLPAFIIVVFTP